MTTPAPAYLSFPDWYKGGFPDVEILMQLLFQPLVGTSQNPEGSWTPTDVVTFLPEPNTYNAQLSSGAYLRVYRMGGRINFDQNKDETRVAIAALTRRRDDSWYLIEFVRQVLNCYQRGGIIPGAPGVMVWMAGEVVGPQQIPEIIQDDRLVQITVELHTKKSIPNYRAVNGL